MQYVTQKMGKNFPVWLFGQTLYNSLIDSQSKLAEHLRGYTYCAANGHSVWTEPSGTGTRLTHLPYFYEFKPYSLTELSTYAGKVAYAPGCLLTEEANENDALIFIADKPRRYANSTVTIQAVHVLYRPGLTGRIDVPASPNAKLSTFISNINTSSQSADRVSYRASAMVNNGGTGQPSIQRVFASSISATMAQADPDIILGNQGKVSIPTSEQGRAMKEDDIRVPTNASMIEPLYFSPSGTPTVVGQDKVRAENTAPLFAAYVEDGTFKKFNLPDSRVKIENKITTTGAQAPKSVIITANIGGEVIQLEF